MHFLLDAKKGKGSHYRVEYGQKWTIIQADLNHHRIRRILRQLDIDPDDIQAGLVPLEEGQRCSTR